MILRSDLMRIMNHFGKYQQFMKLGEEVGELYKAILEFENGIRPTTNEITKEFADVQLVMDQIKELYELSDRELEMVKEFKLQRTLDTYNIE